jgi:GNAT superfamily N-acetyltransferase
MTIREAEGRTDFAEARSLFEEYAQSLGVDLGFQDFDQELDGLPGAYSRPDGILLLAAVGCHHVGSVAVRRHDAETCEMKRLYVRAEARGQGVGRALAEAAIDFARMSGYRAMRLDTLPSMSTAHALYQQLGFRQCPPYRYNPVPGSAFLELRLDRPNNP